MYGDRHLQVLNTQTSSDAKPPAPDAGSKYTPFIAELLAPSSQVVLKGTTTLAGSCDTLLGVFQRLLSLFNVPIAQAIEYVSTTPADIVGLPHIGRLKEGCRADFITLQGVETVIDSGGVKQPNTFRLPWESRNVFVGGQLAYPSPSKDL